MNEPNEMCCFCLSASDVPLTNLFSKDGECLSHFDKISSSFFQLATIFNENKDNTCKLCNKCCNTIDMIYQYKQIWLHNVGVYLSQKCTIKVETEQELNNINFESIDEQNQEKTEQLVIKMETVSDSELNDDTLDESNEHDNAFVKQEITDVSSSTNTCEVSEYLERNMSSKSKGIQKVSLKSNNKLGDESSNSKKGTKVKKKQRNPIIWNKEKTFQDNTALLNVIEEEKCWSKLTYYKDAQDNLVVRYRCNKVKSRGSQCTAALRVIYDSQNGDICLYRSSLGHNHTEMSTRKLPKMSDETKEEIERMFEWDNRIKPLRMQYVISSKNLPMPTMIQINNYLKILRKKKSGNNIFE